MRAEAGAGGVVAEAVAALVDAAAEEEEWEAEVEAARGLVARPADMVAVAHNVLSR